MKSTKLLILSIVLLVIVLAFSMQAQAALQNLGVDDQGNRLIYDTDLDITWYDYSNAANTWDNQVAWAGGLSVTTAAATYNDWRLTTMVDGPYSWGYDGTTTAGYNITTSEMGHLFYSELENKAYYDTSGLGPQAGWGLNNTGAFQNLVAGIYWSGTEHYTSSAHAGAFVNHQGNQNIGYSKDNNNFYAIAVRSGRAIAPEPISSTLFIIGGATLGFRSFRKKCM